MLTMDIKEANGMIYVLEDSKTLLKMQNKAIKKKSKKK